LREKLENRPVWGSNCLGAPAIVYDDLHCETGVNPHVPTRGTWGTPRKDPKGGGRSAGAARGGSLTASASARPWRAHNAPRWHPQHATLARPQRAVCGHRALTAGIAYAPIRVRLRRCVAHEARSIGWGIERGQRTDDRPGRALGCGRHPRESPADCVVRSGPREGPNHPSPMGGQRNDAARLRPSCAAWTNRSKPWPEKPFSRKALVFLSRARRKRDVGAAVANGDRM